MECREFNSMILPHLDGLLRQDQSALLEAHAASCAACARELALQSRLSGAMGAMGREEIIAPPEMGSLVISKLKSERRGYLTWVPAAWRKAVAAAAILLLAGGSAGVTAGLQIAREGKMVALDPPGAVIGDSNETVPAGGGESGIALEGLPGNNQNNSSNASDKVEDDTSIVPKDGEAGNSGAVDALSSSATALLSNSTVITSTMIKVNVADLSEARIQAVALAAGSWANTQVFPEQNGDQKIVVLRLTVASDLAPGLIEKLTGLGALADRQDESRDITALHNETRVLCSELESRRSTAGDAGELQAIDQQISSYRQQLNNWEAEAGKRVIMLWLESN